MCHKITYLISIFLFLTFAPVFVAAQNEIQTESSEEATETTVPEQITVQPETEDSDIENRLSGILQATGWFTDTIVEVNEGVVFLRGTTESDDYKRWAGELTRNTQDVTAVVNQIEVTEPDIWNYEPAFTGMQELWRSIMRATPFLIFGLFVLLFFLGISLLAAKAARASLRKREMNPLLQDITARSVAVIVFLFGLYVVFHIANLTGVALTVLGGTGLLGIVLGIAFRDITENFLASIFLSVQNPFRAGDLVEINGNRGFIQSLTIRATLLMDLDGNHLQIPNSTVYKGNILNYSSNPNQRTTFIIGIGYDDSITSAQEIGARILEKHPAVLKEPEPWILVDKLASSTINLQFYYWVDGSKHNLFKVKSSVLRLVKAAYEAENISMPDEAREIVFPKGVPVDITKRDIPHHQRPGPKKSADFKPFEESKIATGAEGDLKNSDDDIREQARKSRAPEEGEDLLKPQ